VNGTLSTSTPTETRTPDASPLRKRGLLFSLTAVPAAFLASLCCVGPIAFVTLGVGAGLASRFEPLRPVFSVLTLALLALGFYTVYGSNGAAEPESGPNAACGPDGACVRPRNRSKEKALLWAATVIALLLLTFPQWSLLLV
jgi:mercuric ion transport protein